MKHVVAINKPVGMTPLGAILLFKQQYAAYAEAKISYAGRLDPMADGLLLLLIGEENKKRKVYEAMPKTYTFDVLLGVETDTYDILGKVHPSRSNSPILQNNRISSLLVSFVGKKLQPYPPYSSRTVAGKPLYWWARKNKLDEITIPQKEITIYAVDFINQEQISIYDLRMTIHEKFSKVSGDFRQHELLQTWEDFFVQYTSIPDKSFIRSFPVLHCAVSCSSGTYVRSIAHAIGEKLGCGALAYSITRTRIGDYKLSDALSVTAV